MLRLAALVAIVCTTSLGCAPVHDAPDVEGHFVHLHPPHVTLAVDAVPVDVIPADPSVGDVALQAQAVIAGVHSGNLWLAFGPLVTLLTMVVRAKWLRKLLPDAVDKAFDHPIVAMLIPLLLSLAGGVMTAAATGPVTLAAFGAVLVSLLPDVLKVFTEAVTIFIVAKKVGEAKALAAEKAAAIVTKVDAVAELGKGPQP